MGVDTTQYINCQILNNKSTIYSPEYTNMPTLPHWPRDLWIIYYVLPNLTSLCKISCIYNNSFAITKNVPFFVFFPVMITIPFVIVIIFVIASTHKFI